MNRTMNRIAIACVLIAGTAGMAAAQAESFYDNARVRSVEPQYEQFSVPREQCTTQYVTEQRPVQGSRASNGTSIGGAIVDSGKFPWAQHKARFPRLNEPDVSYHGVVYTEALGPAAYIGRARVVPLRNMGAAISPFNAWQILQGVETLALRMDRICENATKVAQFLKNHSKAEWVNYAGLSDHPDNGLVQKYMGGRASGIINFGVKSTDGDGKAAGARFQDALKLVTRLVNIGDCKSLACHPASTTHRQLSENELAKAGVSADMVRLSIGIEHIDDILADLDQALAAV